LFAKINGERRTNESGAARDEEMHNFRLRLRVRLRLRLRGCGDWVWGCWLRPEPLTAIPRKGIACTVDNGQEGGSTEERVFLRLRRGYSLSFLIGINVLF